jgi:hypothetical protein
MFRRLKHRGGRTAPSGIKSRDIRAIHKAFVPIIPLPVVFAFVVVSFGGAVFLSSSFYPSGEAATSSGRSTNDVPVYSAQAVPREPDRAALPAEIVSALNRDGVVQTDSERVEPAQPVRSHFEISSSSKRGEFEGFDSFANSHPPEIHLSLAEVPIGLGISAQSNSTGHSAPDAESFSSVPEPSTWIAGAALLGLVGARWLRARWRRSQRPLRL